MHALGPDSTNTHACIGKKSTRKQTHPNLHHVQTKKSLSSEEELVKSKLVLRSYQKEMGGNWLTGFILSNTPTDRCFDIVYTIGKSNHCCKGLSF